jgi:hypothetical protein
VDRQVLFVLLRAKKSAATAQATTKQIPSSPPEMGYGKSDTGERGQYGVLKPGNSVNSGNLVKRA